MDACVLAIHHTTTAMTTTMLMQKLLVRRTVIITTVIQLALRGLPESLRYSKNPVGYLTSLCSLQGMGVL